MQRGNRPALRQLVLERLTEGPATNVDLNRLCFRYGARILELREAGHNIVTSRLNGSVFLYSLIRP